MKITGENLTPDLRQQVELLCATPVGSVVLDRDFGLDMSFLDEPVSVAVNMAAAEISVKLEKYIPALRLIRVKADYDSAEQGIIDFEVIVEEVVQS